MSKKRIRIGRRHYKILDELAGKRGVTMETLLSDVLDHYFSLGKYSEDRDETPRGVYTEYQEIDEEDQVEDEMKDEDQLENEMEGDKEDEERAEENDDGEIDESENDDDETEESEDDDDEIEESEDDDDEIEEPEDDN